MYLIDFDSLLSYSPTDHFHYSLWFPEDTGYTTDQSNLKVTWTFSLLIYMSRSRITFMIHVHDQHEFCWFQTKDYSSLPLVFLIGWRRLLRVVTTHIFCLIPARCYTELSLYLLVPASLKVLWTNVCIEAKVPMRFLGICTSASNV